MNERMVFIGVIIVLVAVLGVAGGYILFKYNPHTALTSVNNSTADNNSTSSGSNNPQTNSQSSSNIGNNDQGQSNTPNADYISASQAMSIANSIIEGHNLKATGAELIQSNPHPYYLVSLYNTKDDIYSGTVSIDAITGEQIHS